MRILITGGAGFIGSHVADALIERGHRITIIDNLSSGNTENINRRAKFYKFDINNRKRLEKVFEKVQPEAVFHFAAFIQVRASVEHPSIDAATNIMGSLTLLEVAAKYSLKKFVFASSAALFDETAPRPIPETAIPQPSSPYGISKHAVEHYLRFFHTIYGLPYVILRFANVYGPRQNPHGEAGVIAIFLDRMLTEATPTIHGDGHATRDYIYVSDIVAANIRALDTEVTEGVFHIGTGIETTVNDIFRMINWQFGKKFEEVHGPAKPGEAQACSLDATHALQRLDWQPQVALAEGIVATATWFKARSREN